jgi:hypothetical protein
MTSSRKGYALTLLLTCQAAMLLKSLAFAETHNVRKVVG